MPNSGMCSPETCLLKCPYPAELEMTSGHFSEDPSEEPFKWGNWGHQEKIEVETGLNKDRFEMTEGIEARLSMVGSHSRGSDSAEGQGFADAMVEDLVDGNPTRNRFPQNLFSFPGGFGENVER